MYSDYYLRQLMSAGAGFIFFLLAIVVVLIVAQWKIFVKAGKPGWASIVPFYSSYVEYAIFWGNGWLFLVPIVLSLVVAVPVIGWILGIIEAVILILHQYKTAEAFGQGLGFTIGLILLHPIFICMLAFGSYTYKGVPIDGVSYKEMKAKFDKADAKAKVTNFDAPPAEKVRPVEFEKPQEAKPAEQRAQATAAVRPEPVESPAIDVEPIKEEDKPEGGEKPKE